MTIKSYTTKQFHMTIKSYTTNNFT